MPPASGWRQGRRNPPVDALEGYPATLQAVQRVLERLGRQRPVVLIIEDAHWADRSTRDLVAYLTSTGSTAPLALVVTYRSDDLYSGHPLRLFVAELERRPNVVHLQLEPLGRADSTALLAAILGGPPDPQLSEAIFRRSEGNPFFVEELAGVPVLEPQPAALKPDAALPRLLSTLLSARVERLSENTQFVLRVAAVGGRRVEHDRLAAVVPLDGAALADAIREARAANVLTAEPGSRRYEFRHALLHEAVYADVLPGERSLYHAKYAEHLTTTRAQPGMEGWADLSYHWRAAGRTEEALVATLDAAIAAEAGYALPEAYAFYELALELWDVTRPPSETPLTRTELLARAADAASRAGSLARAVDLVTLAIYEVDVGHGPDRRRAAPRAARRGSCGGWGAPTRRSRSITRRSGSVPPVPPSTARARVLAAYADALERRGASAEARDHASEAIAVAVATGAALEEGHAHHALGLALGALGDREGGVAELDRARRLAERNGDVADVAGTYVHLWRMLTEQGQAEEMVNLAIDAAEFCKAADMDVAGQLLDCLAAAFLYQLGRWDEAEARLAVDEHRLWGLSAVVTDVVHGLIDIDRGALASAGERLEAARCLGAQIYDGRINGLLYRGLAELAIWERRFDDALAAVTTGLGLTGDDEMRARLCALGVRAAADRAEQQRGESGAWGEPAESPELAAALHELDARALARQAPEVSEVRAATATADAEMSRLSGRSDPERWHEAARRWHELGFPAPAAYCRWRLAEAVLAEGRRSDAIELWQRAHEAADRLGAESLRLAIEAEAARAAVPLVPAAGSDGAGAVPFGLTARELEVLTLVAAGRTNREIGQALSISEKTASVHVSRILAKLGARSRAQAAGIAGQLGLAGAGCRPSGEE